MGSQDSRVKTMTEANNAVLYFDGTKERIKKLFNEVQLSVSSYDTAWVALVPSPNSFGTPCFPECIGWLLDNRLSNGSWGLLHRHPLLIKDALSSTLASILALKRWGVGEEQINKGLRFIELNITSATDENQHSPIGFDIIFPGMLEFAKDLNLNLPFEPKDLDAMLHMRELELRRGGYSEGRKSYLAYISEGMGKLQDWEMVLKYQRKNGSLFNSPSTTAAASMHLQNAGCLNYLRLLLEKFGNAVPTVYPLDIYARLCMVDSLESLGIERHIRQEIKSVLDETYREEEIFLDTATCAMAFRILRLNGYDVSSDPLTQITKGKHESSFLSGHQKEIGDALELCRASQIIILPDESALEKQHSWSSHFLKEKLYNCTIHADRLDKFVSQEVDDTLKFPFHANLGRAANRRYIEHYNADIWVVENRLDKLKFARQKNAYCYFSAAASLFSPELSDARISWAKNGILTTVVDDFFDVGGSIECAVNHRWDVDVAVDCCSEHVQIIFSALQSTISEIGAKAFTIQGRSVTSHIIDVWLSLMNSMLREAKWVSDKSVPTRDAYMTNGFVLFALGPIVLPALYLVGPVLSEEVVCSSEYQNLYKVMSTFGRLRNDIHSFERESKEGKLNVVSLYMVDGSGGTVTAEASIKKIKSIIVSQRRELLRLVLQEKGSLVPRACKDLFWKMLKVLSLFYMKDDGFTSHELMNVVKKIIYKPISLSYIIIQFPPFYNLERESMEGKLNAVSLLHMVDGSGGTVTAEKSIKEIKSIIISQRRELLRLVLQEKGSLVPRACKDLF
ncbi:unnamed protein product [Camellia sinensis]